MQGALWVTLRGRCSELWDWARSLSWGEGSSPVSLQGMSWKFCLEGESRSSTGINSLKERGTRQREEAHVLEHTRAWTLRADLQETIPTQPRSDSLGRAHSELCPRGCLTEHFITTEFPKAVRTPSDFPRCFPRSLPKHVTWVLSLSQVDPLEEKMATPSSLGQKCLVGYSPRGPKESDRTEQQSTHKQMQVPFMECPLYHECFLGTGKYCRNQHIFFIIYPPPHPNRKIQTRTCKARYALWGIKIWRKETMKCFMLGDIAL